MNSSLLYHTWGLYFPKCTKEEQDITIILHVEIKVR